MLKIRNIIFFCGVLATTLSSAEPAVLKELAKESISQEAPEDAPKKACWQRRKKRKKFRRSIKTAAKIALALGVTYVGIKHLVSLRYYFEDKVFFEAFEQYKKTHKTALAKDSEGYVFDESAVKDMIFKPSTEFMHDGNNIKQKTFGLNRLRYLQRGLKIDYDSEVHDLIRYLRSRECLYSSKDRRKIIIAARSMLGIDYSDSGGEGHGNIFAENSCYCDQLETCGIEVVGRTWYFIKNYKDALGKKESGLEDIMVRALAYGVDHGSYKVCFIGKVEHICKDVWAGRCFSVTEQINLKTFVTELLQQILRAEASDDFEEWDKEKTGTLLTEIENRRAAIENIKDFNPEKFKQEIIASCAGLSMQEESLEILKTAFGLKE